MKFAHALSRLMTKVMIFSFLSVSLYLPVTQAAMVGTQQLLSQQQAQHDRAHLQELLNRADLTAQLEAAGVDPAKLQARIATLTDEEVALLNEQLDQLPAGGGVLGVAVFIFLVLLATDILGYTDVFPFVKKTIN
jgi:hypothetical protein